MAPVMRCPTCRKLLAGDPDMGPYRPFCSERCRTMDLGNWLGEAYRVSRPVEEDDLDLAAKTGGNGDDGGGDA